MKWLIYLLVLANVAFFAWQYRQPHETTPVSRTAPAAAERRMALVSEVDISALEPRADPEKKIKQAGTTKQPAPESSTRLASTVTPAVQQVRATRSTAGQTKQSKGSVPTASTPSSTRSSMVRASKSSRYCYTTGPFAADESVEDLIIWLTEQGGRIESRWSEQKKPNRYWVYLPPRKTVEEARSVLRRLNDDGFQDYVRIMRGPMRNAISLGLYSQRKFADQRMAQLRNKGYEPKMDIRYKTERVRWLDIVFADKPGFSETTFRVEYPKVSWVAAQCR